MNYVYEKDYAVLVRLKVPKGASGTVPIRASARWLACTDKICVPEQGDFRSQLPIGRESATGTRSSTSGSGACRGRSSRLRSSRLPATSSAWRSRCRATSQVEQALFLPGGRRAGRLCGRAELPSARRPADRRAPAPVGRARPHSMESFPTATGRGWSFSAVAGRVPEGGRAIGETGTQAILWAVLGAIARRASAQPDALRLPDPRAEGAASGEERRRRARGTPRCAGYAAGAIVGTGALG